ncbi:MAG: hypothetical protein HC897_13465 [Thermoanaerobaculia bacterium]|nr:hypothetical protein [Thermoanaerobaculia bacterium]
MTRHPLIVLLRRDPVVVATLAVFVGTGALYLLPILEPKSLELFSRRLHPLLFLPWCWQL